MKKISYFILILVVAIVSCSNPQKQAQQDISAAETAFYGNKETRLDEKTALDLITKYVDYSTKYQEDTASAEYLFKAAELSMNMNQGSQAIQYFEKIKKNYPQFGKSAEVIFMIGFVYENQLTNYEKAKEYYQQFMAQYPGHDLFDDAEASIRNMGKPLDQLIEEFEAANVAED